jgi:hypothetical protein
VKCPGCEYELWNLKAGPCPECGRPFKPSDFDFLPNAVKFCCPHCSQAYYGTSDRGQLEPDAFDCVSCGRAVTCDEMLLLPAEELGTRTPTKSINPWLDSNRKRRWFATIGSGIGQPGRLLEATPAIGSTSRATSYALLNFAAAGLFMLVMGALLSFSGGGSGAVFFLMMTAAFILGPLIYAGLWTLVTHGVLKVFRQPTPDGMGRTFQAIAFTSGACLVALIPCLGPMVAFAAWAACAPMAVRSAHKCSVVSAIVATLVPPLLVAAAGIAMYASLVFGVAYSAQSTAFQQAWASQSQLDYETIALANELRSDVQAGTPPLHGASLLGRNSMIPYFVFDDGTTFDVPIGTELASSLDSMGEPRRRSTLKAITSGWPADVTAHRIGRIVFTHHGIDAADDPGLWLMIELPNSPGDTIADAVHLRGASMFDVATGSQFEIDQQNQLRANAGLPPLPDFQTLTAGSGPWTASDGAPLPSPPGVP